MQDSPLISCLCVTHNKPELLKRAIRCFQRQSYPHKELIIVYEEGDMASHKLAMSIQSETIRPVLITNQPKLTLGQLRNIAVDVCKGDYFCQWDDDDWYHPLRIELQWQAIRRSNKPASALTYWLMFDTLTGDAYCSHHRIWEGSILCKTDIARTTIRYPDFEKGEDNLFIHQLYTTYGICHLPLPFLYVYTYNGHNTWGYDHFMGLFEKANKLSRHSSDIIRQTLDESQPDSLLKDDTLLDEIEHVIFRNHLPSFPPVSDPGSPFSRFGSVGES